MASPQIENGHTDIANELMDALCKTRVPGEARQVLDAVIRKTYGWHKKVDAISLSQFVEATGLSKPHVVNALKKLFEMNLITEKGKAITENGNELGKLYEINKNYDTWKPLPKKVTLPKKVKGGYPKKVKGGYPKKGTTKENYTKENYTKENIYIPFSEIIDYLNTRTSKNYRSSTKSIRHLIKVRYHEGFTLDDFKTVIDNQTVKWLNDPKMREYLRPETLFGTKFESYLNSTPTLAQANLISPSSVSILEWADKKQREAENG